MISLLNSAIFVITVASLFTGLFALGFSLYSKRKARKGYSVNWTVLLVCLVALVIDIPIAYAHKSKLLFVVYVAFVVLFVVTLGIELHSRLHCKAKSDTKYKTATMEKDIEN